MSDITKLTPKLLESKIKSEQYHQFDNTTVTVCCLTLQNGFNVIGESACISPAYFDAEIGKKVAREKAFDQLWKLYGFNAKQEQLIKFEWVMEMEQNSEATVNE